MPQENILAIPRALFDLLGPFHGINQHPATWLPHIFNPDNNLFLPRDAAENDPTHKQLIPYAIIHSQGRILHYTRSKKVGEQRLAGKGSIGIGGHINDNDHTWRSLDTEGYQNAVLRELHEELNIAPPYTNTIAALLNDDTNEVGRVHLGIIHLIHLDTPQATPREDAIGNPTFLTIQEIQQRRENLESWSQLCADALHQLLPSA